jgi:hypothetical protein
MDLDVDVDVNVLCMDKLYMWMWMYCAGFESPAVELVVFCLCFFFKFQANLRGMSRRRLVCVIYEG